VGFALGFSDEDCERIRDGVVDQGAQKRIRHPEQSSEADRRRARMREPQLKEQFERRKRGSRAAVRWARSKIGKHESPAGSNWGLPVQKWITFTGYDGPVLWCGCFVCFAVVNRGGADVPNRIRLGFDGYVIDDAQNERNGFQGAVSPSAARAGDIATFDFGEGRRHIALVAGPTRNGMIHTIDGNTSRDDGTNPNGGEVAEHRRPVSLVTCVGRLRY
jgi:hypothetical protein